MTDIVKRKRVTDLSVEERASLGQKLFISKAKGRSVRSLAMENELTEYAVRTMITEYGAYLRETNTHTKEANIAAYDFVLEKAAQIIENPQNYSVLLQAKGYEAFIQALTRKDKLLGHEAPTHNINTKGETLSDLWERMYGPQGESNGISPIESGYIGIEEEEEVQEAEVVYDPAENTEG